MRTYTRDLETLPAFRLIYAALKDACLKEEKLETLEKQCNEIADRIYRTDGRGRTRDTIFKSIWKGEIGEHGIAEILKSKGLDVKHNDETRSGDYSWDLTVEGLTVEIKSQTLVSGKKFFGFESPDHDQTMREKWKTLDLIVPFFNVGGYVVPWIMVLGSALNPEEELYGRSKENAGYYLKNGVATSRGFCRELADIESLKKWALSS